MLIKMTNDLINKLKHLPITVIEILKSDAKFWAKVKRLTIEFKKYKKFSDDFDKQLFNL